MTQGELARRVKCHKSTISLIIRGLRTPSKNMAQRLSKAVPGTRFMDWMFSEQNRSHLEAAIRRAE